MQYHKQVCDMYGKGKMKKVIVKTAVFLLTFFITLVVAGKFMNRGNHDMTLKMGAATLPLVTFYQGDNPVNELHGHTVKMDVSSMASTVIALGEKREISFRVAPFDSLIEKIVLEVRSSDGSRLIEQTEIIGVSEKNGHIKVDTALKDLLEKDKEYAIVVVLTDDGGRESRFYTRCIWGKETYAAQKVAFVKDFYEKTFDKEAAKELIKYMESNSQGNNTTLHKVNIHSSFHQLTWGELPVTPVTEPVIDILELGPDTGSFALRSMVSTGEGKDIVYYAVEEYYRIRYTATRVYLLDFERTMTRLPQVEGDIYANDKIMLGIAGADVELAESQDGNFLAYELAGRLSSYHVKTNKAALLYSFYDAENWDARTLYDAHDIEILKVAENGNVTFAVYGYFNRGRHEGEIGIGVYAFDNGLNTIEELVYIPYGKSPEILQCGLEKLLYLNENHKLYLYLDQGIYEVDLEEREVTELIRLVEDDTLHTSPEHQILLWNQGNSLQVRNLETEKETRIPMEQGETARALGFMGEDIIYGVIRETDIVEDASGRQLLPMYQVVICDSDGRVQKKYQEENIYTVSVSIVDNQITLNQLKKLDDGNYTETIPEHIVNNEEQVSGRNKLVTVAVDVYETITQIQVKSNIDAKSIQILTPKEVVFEGSRNVELTSASGKAGDGEIASRQERLYYVYDQYGVHDVYFDPARAVALAYETSGRVVDQKGKTIWFKGNRVARNQIMAITEPDKTTKEASLAACLDTILRFEGITVQSQLMLEEGKDALEILQAHLADAKVADLTGCPMDGVLYFVNKDIPVLAMLADGEAVLITGFNEFNTVIFEPSTGKLYKKGMNDSANWFAENGNRFITYFVEE